MASDVQIANLALDAIGARATIASLSENSAEARALSRQFEQAREDVLSAAHWNFARKQLTLTLLKDGTLSPPDTVPQPWLYEYAYPSDCVAARYVMPLFTDVGVGASIFGPDFAMGARGDSQSPPVRFLVSTDEDDQGNPLRVILTNQPQAVLVYTARITNPQVYDGPFTRALANYLGALVSIALTGDKALARQAFQIADNTTKEARRINGNEGITVIDSVPDWLRTRGIESQASSGAYIQNPTDLSFIT